MRTLKTPTPSRVGGRTRRIARAGGRCVIPALFRGGPAGRKGTGDYRREEYHVPRTEYQAARTWYSVRGTWYWVPDPSVRRLQTLALQHRRPHDGAGLVEGGAVEGQELGVGTGPVGRGRQGDGHQRERGRVERRFRRRRQA